MAKSVTMDCALRVCRGSVDSCPAVSGAAASSKRSAKWSTLVLAPYAQQPHGRLSPKP